MSEGCLVQFDGSAHKHTQTGGAGVSLLHVTPSTTTLVQWLSIPLLSCADNVIAEAHACRAAIRLAFEYYVSCLSKGIYVDSVVVQGDILPIINYLQHKGRVKKPAVVAILDQCQQLLARAPCLSALSIYQENVIDLQIILQVRPALRLRMPQATHWYPCTMQLSRRINLRNH